MGNTSKIQFSIYSPRLIVHYTVQNIGIQAKKAIKNVKYPKVWLVFMHGACLVFVYRKMSNAVEYGFYVHHKTRRAQAGITDGQWLPLQFFAHFVGI